MALRKKTEIRAHPELGSLRSPWGRNVVVVIDAAMELPP
jgi:hypothetical protein